MNTQTYVCAITLACALTAPTHALALSDDWNTPARRNKHNDYSTPQNGAFELRLGTYLPDVDRGNSSGAFTSVFGSDDRYIVGFEVDWQIFRLAQFASVGVGAGLSYTKMTGHGLTLAGEPSQEENSFALYPMHAALVLRLDFLARETPVPLVPYGKAGLGYAIWRAADDGGTLEADNGDDASDVSYGTHLALGLMLLLDPFDPDAAIQFDETSGVNNSYFFAEFTMRDLDGFDGSKMQVGDDTWIFGLALEF